MSAIFDNAYEIKLSHKQSIPMFISQSGFRSAQIRSPYLYAMSVSLNPMDTTDDNYFAVKKEIRDIRYGANILRTTVPLYTRHRGSWLGTPAVSGYSAGRSGIMLDGFTANQSNVIRDGDFVQFSNSTKVYEIQGDYDSDSSGRIIVHRNSTSDPVALGLTLNTPLFQEIYRTTTVIIGSNVVFNLQLESYKDEILTPLNQTKNRAEWGEFIFTEVL